MATLCIRYFRLTLYSTKGAWRVALPAVILDALRLYRKAQAQQKLHLGEVYQAQILGTWTG